MALPSPDQLKKREPHASLPNPNTIVPSLIKQKETGDRYVSQMRAAPDLLNPFQVQSNASERFSPSQAVQTPQRTTLPSPSELLRDQNESSVFAVAARENKVKEQEAKEKRQSQALTSPVTKALQKTSDAISKLSPITNMLPAPKEDTVGMRLASDVMDFRKDVRSAQMSSPVGRFMGGVDQGASMGLTSYLDRVTGDPETAEQITQTTAGKVGEFGGMLLPGGAAFKLAKGIKPLAKLSNPWARNAAIGGAAGAMFETASELNQEGLGLNDQTLPQRLTDIGIGTALGAGGDVAFYAGGRLLSNARNAAQDVISGQLKAASAIESASRSVPTNRLNVSNNTDVLNRVMAEIKPIVSERMTPPLENPNELAKWLKPHLGDVSLNDVRSLPYEDMRQLASEAQKSMNVYDTAKVVARERGHNLDSLLNNETPTLKQAAERLRMGGIAGAIEPPKNARVAIRNDMPVKEAPKRIENPKEPWVIGSNPIGEQAARQPSKPTLPIPEKIAPQRATAPYVTPSTSERGFNRTLRHSENVTPQVKKGLAQSPDRTYTPITNEETLKRANNLIEQRGLDSAEAQLMIKKRFDADDVATSMRMIQKLQESGQVERAVTVADKLATQLTEAGQTVQAASIWNRLSPEGALLAAQRKVTRINENLFRGQEPVKISPEQAQTITDTAGAIQASGASQERAGTVMEIMDRVRKGEDILPDEKQTVLEFVDDAKRFLKPSETKVKLPRTPRQPKEMIDTRVRDRVTSFLEEQEKAALERIKARRGRANALPLDEWADYAVVGATKLAKGAIKFADWSEQMVRDLGDSIRPYLNDIYEKSQEVQSQSAKKINDQVISRAERVAEGYIKSNESKLSNEDVDFIRNMARKVSSLSDQEKRLASQDLQAILQGFEKVGIGRKLSSAQYISMLLNPLTQIRNIVGNELLYRLERMAKVISTPLDIASSKVTGGPRTVTFKRGAKVWEDYFKPSKDYFGSLGEGLKAGWKGVSPEGLTSKYEIQGQAFRSKYNPVTYLEKSLGAALQGFDYAAYTRAANQTMSEMAYLDALNKGIRGKDAIRNHMQTFMTNMDDATHNIAREYGKFVTLQNDSLLAQKVTGFRRGLNHVSTFGLSKDFGAGSVVVPFAKTPANLLLRGIDYSPAGVLKALKQTHDVLRNPNTDLTRADVMMTVSRSLIGTGLGATAYWLADKGALFGQSNKDSETRKLMQGTGIRDFQINGSALMRMLNAIVTGGDIDQAAKIKPGDTLWAYEWAQPTSMPIAIGSNIHQSVKQKQGALQTAGEAALAGASTLLDSSVLSGIREAFQIPQGEDNAFKAILNNLMKQVPSQFTPSLMRQFNTLFDDTLKETYSMPGDTLGKFTNSAKSSIPYLSQQMPQRVSTLGEPQTRLNTFLDVFVSPSARNIYKPTPEAQLVIDLLNETGDGRVAPRAVQKYLTGKDIATGEQRKADLTPDQFVELQTIVGQETANRLKKINPNLSTEKKVEKVIEAFDQAGKIGRNKIKQDVGLRKTK